jgi:hypothetical protein
MSGVIPSAREHGALVDPEKKISEAKSSANRQANRNLRWLWIGFVLYFFIMLYAVRYALTVPYQLLVLGGVLNMAIIISFVVAIRRGYRRTAGHPGGNETGSEVTSDATREADRRRLRWLWVGAGLYFLIFLNGLGYAGKVPRPVLILGAVLNGAILITFILTIRRAYRRMGSGKPPQPKH